MSSYSYTATQTETFTITHAKHMGAKVAADLMRVQRLYGSPSTADILAYEQEVVLLLKVGFLGSVTYGYMRNEKWIEPTLNYSAAELSGTGADDSPGRIRPGADVSGATFYSFLTYSSAYSYATQSEKDAVDKELPFSRTGASTPGVNGYFVNDQSYSSGGRVLNRSTVRSF